MTLVIMAAGIGSRFGGGIKQLQRVDDRGHIIMDYSIHDAIQAGFKHIVFIIRHDIEKDFKEVIGERIESLCGRLGINVSYVYQEMYGVSGGRTKPYGTGHAVLACKAVIDEPFVVINADDYYGKTAFTLLYRFLNDLPQNSKGQYCMAGFVLKNTLSENGGVTRGICMTNDNGYLLNIVETPNIVKTASGAESEGVSIDTNSCVSMNMWGFTSDIMELLADGFDEFLLRSSGDLKAEFLIPIYIQELLDTRKANVQVLESHDKWFGMTYKEDIPMVKAEFSNLIKSGDYSSALFDDLYKFQKEGENNESSNFSRWIGNTDFRRITSQTQTDD